MHVTEHQLHKVQLPGVKAQEGKEGHWSGYGSGITTGIRKDIESSRTLDLHSIVLHSLPSFTGHDAAVCARVLFLGIQDLQSLATWAKGVS